MPREDVRPRVSFDGLSGEQTLDVLPVNAEDEEEVECVLLATSTDMLPQRAVW